MVQVVEGSLSTRRRILFVDDEQHVLDGLQNLLRKQRREWDMSFALGGASALAAFAEAPFDIVVADMRMPGMDGAQLLSEIRDAYPATARIVLSGHAERESVTRALAVAHQFLTKPCDPDLLRRVVARVCGLQSLLFDPRMRELIGRIDRLPSVPQVYVELIDALVNESGTTAQIAAIIERDPAMTAKVLQLVNSSYFGLARRVSSISEAVGYLGSDLLRSLALTAQVFVQVQTTTPAGVSLERLQEQALLGSRLARALLSTDLARANDAFTSALVRDLGSMVLALGIPADYGRVVAAAGAEPLHVTETRELGVSHAEVGAYLLGVWGLPPTIVEAVAHHHEPATVDHDDRAVLDAVHVAAEVADAVIEGRAPRIVAALKDRLDGPHGWAALIARELERLDLGSVEL